MFDFFKKLFIAERSSDTAKERLRLVLLSDHLSLAPETIDALKRDLLEVISRYVEIDPDHADVTFEQREREVAMLASIPITGVRERKPQATPLLDVQQAAESAYASPETGEPPELPEATEPAGDEPQFEPALALGDDMADSGEAPSVPTRASHAGPPRRRRRRKNAAKRAATGGAPPAPSPA